MFLTLTKRRLNCRYTYFADTCAKHIQILRSASPRFSHLTRSTKNTHGNSCGFSSRWAELIGISWCGPRLLSHLFGGKEWKPRGFGERWGSTCTEEPSVSIETSCDRNPSNSVENHLIDSKLCAPAKGQSKGFSYNSFITKYFFLLTW